MTTLNIIIIVCVFIHCFIIEYPVFIVESLRLWLCVISTTRIRCLVPTLSQSGYMFIITNFQANSSGEIFCYLQLALIQGGKCDGGGGGAPHPGLRCRLCLALNEGGWWRKREVLLYPSWRSTAERTLGCSYFCMFFKITNIVCFKFTYLAYEWFCFLKSFFTLVTLNVLTVE